MPERSPILLLLMLLYANLSVPISLHAILYKHGHRSRSPIDPEVFGYASAYLEHHLVKASMTSKKHAYSRMLKGHLPYLVALLLWTFWTRSLTSKIMKQNRSHFPYDIVYTVLDPTVAVMICCSVEFLALCRFCIVRMSKKERLMASRAILLIFFVATNNFLLV